MLLLAWVRDGERTRDSILAAVRQNPGTNATSLSLLLGLAWSTVRYHLRVMRSEGRVQLQQTGRDLAVYPPEVPRVTRAAIRALRDPEAGRVLEAVLAASQVPLSEVSQRLGLSRKTVRRHLSNLVESGLVERSREPTPTYQARRDLTRRLGGLAGGADLPAPGGDRQDGPTQDSLAGR